MDLRADSSIDVSTSRIRKPTEVLENERAKPMRLDALERRDLVQACLAQERWPHEVARPLGAAALVDKSQLEQAPEPWPQSRGVRELERVGELNRGKTFRLRNEPENNPFALRELVTLVGLREQPDNPRLHHASRHRDVHGVRAFGDRRRASTAREKALEEEIDSAARLITTIITDSTEGSAP